MLPLVVTDASRVEASVTNGRFERRRDPQLQRVRRLNIVVSVDQHGRRAGFVELLAEDHRPAGGRDHLRLKPHVPHDARDVLGDFGDAITVRTDARTTDVVDQPLQARLAVALDVVEDIGELRAALVAHHCLTPSISSGAHDTRCRESAIVHG